MRRSGNTTRGPAIDHIASSAEVDRAHRRVAWTGHEPRPAHVRGPLDERLAIEPPAARQLEDLDLGGPGVAHDEPDHANNRDISASMNHPLIPDSFPSRLCRPSGTNAMAQYISPWYADGRRATTSNERRPACSTTR